MISRQEWIENINYIQDQYDDFNINSLLKNLNDYQVKRAWIEITPKSNFYQSLEAISQNHFKKCIFTFDIEFQVYKLNKPNNSYNKSDDRGYKYYFIRELGYLIFLWSKENRNWYYVGSMIVNFNFQAGIRMPQYAVKLLRPPYITMSSKKYNKFDHEKLQANITTFFKKHIKKYKNKKKMEGIINDLINDFSKGSQKEVYINHLLLTLDVLRNKIIELIDSIARLYKIDKERADKHSFYFIDDIKRYMHEIFYGDLGIRDRKIVDTINNIYLNDELVEGRTLNKKQEYQFINNLHKLQNQIMLVHKGKTDIYAMQNTYRMLTGQSRFELDFRFTYDIEILNGISRILFGSAKLESTYFGLLNLFKDINFDDTFRVITSTFEVDGILKAHDPSADAYFTIMVAILLNSSILKCIKLDKLGGGFDSMYKDMKQKYKKYKKKYLDTKRNK